MRNFFVKLACVIGLAIGVNGADMLNGAGASFPANVYMAWLKMYEQANGVKVNYQSIGSGGGIKQIKQRISDFGGTDEPLKSDELSKSKLLQFPTITGAIVLAYNIDGIKDGELKFSNEVVEGIFLGEITNWNDERIKKDNPTLKLPNQKISLVHRSDGSGTTYNFTLWMSSISKKWSDKIGTGKSVAWVSGIGAKGNEGVAHIIKQTKGSVGYLELSYKIGAGLDAGLLKSKGGNWVSANATSIANASKNSSFLPENDFYGNLILQAGESYPIVSASFILLPIDSARSKKVIEFFSFAFKNGDDIAKKMGFNPLPDELKSKILKYTEGKLK